MKNAVFYDTDFACFANSLCKSASEERWLQFLKLLGVDVDADAAEGAECVEFNFDKKSLKINSSIWRSPVECPYCGQTYRTTEA